MNAYDKIRKALNTGDSCDLLAAMDALAELEKAAQTPAPVAAIREVEITDEVYERIRRHYLRSGTATVNGAKLRPGKAMLDAVRAELGPALGMVELKEPTPEEYKQIFHKYLNFGISNGFSDTRANGRAMFDAYRAVMLPKEGL